MSAQHRQTLKVILQNFSAKVLALMESHENIPELLRQVQRGLERSIENVPRKIN